MRTLAPCRLSEFRHRLDRQMVGHRFDQEIAVTRDIQPPDTWAVTWTQVSGTFNVLRKYRYGTAGRRWSRTLSGRPVRSRPTHPNYNDQDFWEAAYAAALAQTPIEPTGRRVWSTASTIPRSHIFGVSAATARPSRSPACRWRTSSRIFAAARGCAPTPPHRSTSRISPPASRATSSGGRCRRAMRSGRCGCLGSGTRRESDALLKFVERGHAIVRDADRR